MKEYNYINKNNYYHTTNEINEKLNEKQLSIIDNLKKLNNNIRVKKFLNPSKYEPNQSFNNQTIIHSKVNNYRPFNEFIIKLNDIGNKIKNKRNLSPGSVFIPKQQSYKNETIYKYLKKDNSVIRGNNIGLNNNKINDLKIKQNKNIKPVKPYKKKSVLFNPNNTKENFHSLKLDLTNLSETNNSNCVTDRTMNKTKISILKEDEDSSFIIFNDNKSNKNIKNNNEDITLRNKPIKVLFINNKNRYTLNKDNNNINTNKKLCRKIPLSKKYMVNKQSKGFKTNSKKNLLKGDIIDNLYHKRFTQILMLLLEKYFKTYLLKNKYAFLNRLKLYKYSKKKSIKNKPKTIKILYNNNYSTSRNGETKEDLFYKTNYKTLNENKLLNKLKNENVKTSPDKINISELFRNKNELFKKEEVIKKRKNGKSRNKSKEKNKNIIYNTIQNNNFIKKNNSIDNIFKLNSNNFFYNKSKPILIVKKLKTKDNRIHIDIKYLEQFNNYHKIIKPFTKLNISKTDSINIGKKINNDFQFDKIYYKIENQDNYIFKKKKQLSCIQEEE